MAINKEIDELKDSIGLEQLIKNITGVGGVLGDPIIGGQFVADLDIVYDLNKVKDKVLDRGVETFKVYYDISNSVSSYTIVFMKTYGIDVDRMAKLNLIYKQYKEQIR